MSKKMSVDFVVLTAAFVVLGLSIFGLISHQDEEVNQGIQQTRAEPQENKQRSLTFRRVNSLEYAQDLRTGICFAGNYRILATVNCDDVPAHMLATSE